VQTDMPVWTDKMSNSLDLHFVLRKRQKEKRFVDIRRWTMDVTLGACAQGVDGVL
jgi:hypothetical protein